MKIKHSVLLALIAMIAIYVWFKMPTVMIIGLIVMISIMSVSAVLDIFKKIHHENKKNKL